MQASQEHMLSSTTVHLHSSVMSAKMFAGYILATRWYTLRVLQNMFERWRLLAVFRKVQPLLNGQHSFFSDFSHLTYSSYLASEIGIYSIAFGRSIADYKLTRSSVFFLASQRNWRLHASCTQRHSKRYFLIRSCVLQRSSWSSLGHALGLVTFCSCQTLAAVFLTIKGHKVTTFDALRIKYC